ncbi:MULTISPECIES: LLM class flavin-dependent oxidoreductase [unclassified Dietzia]|uniref:LLM class flavin-dependent oxidoreductase n=1 Tax=unclassified Dietzia TaxID=2617939 RepID=UPI0015F91E1A|nr:MULTISPECIES: LLM class flavin-dependent oxidoreductase [unclassified Dietzia]MBB1022986.1 LLM class flavin-dependent oxidoreductase [Dietzia sp. DQ12-76]MBB1028780.1 LLM class flavin-dependent oxidoreductase [Dietzia sp. DQ11-38-2]
MTTPHHAPHDAPRHPRRIRFNAFAINGVGHQLPGLWRHPADRSRDYRDLTHWTRLARLLEEGLFDGIFLADALGPYDVYGGSADAALRTAAKIPMNDPMMLVSAMAAVTEHLGFGITASTSAEHPYTFARRMSTLDHLTRGRVGWNVVTGYLTSAARNLGQDDQLSHDERYDRADEYLEVLYKLWEGSWEDDAVVLDAERDTFVDPAKVHPIDHHGTYFTVPGIHLSEPSAQRTPVIYQAGASERGVRFATENAEAIFVASPTLAQTREQVGRIRDGLEAAGRGRDAARVYALLTIVVDQTDAAAAAKYRDVFSYASETGNLVLNSGWSGIDLSREHLDAPLDPVATDAIQTTVSSLSGAADPGGRWTLRDSARFNATGGPVVVGSGDTVADALEHVMAETDVDGFNLAYALNPGTWEDVVEFLIPVLQHRGLYPRVAEPGTLRARMFGDGDRLPESHRGAAFRRG